MQKNKEFILTILGEKWTLKFVHEQDDKYLKNADGYTDKTTRKIVVLGYPPEDSEPEDWESYLKKCIRHEIIHAYLFESGLAENFHHQEFGHDETMIDFIAIQFPKILQTFEDAEAL